MKKLLFISILIFIYIFNFYCNEKNNNYKNKSNYILKIKKSNGLNLNNKITYNSNYNYSSYNNTREYSNKTMLAIGLSTHITGGVMHILSFPFLSLNPYLAFGVYGIGLFLLTFGIPFLTAGIILTALNNNKSTIGALITGICLTLSGPPIIVFPIFMDFSLIISPIGGILTLTGICFFIMGLITTIRRRPKKQRYHNYGHKKINEPEIENVFLSIYI